MTNKINGIDVSEYFIDVVDEGGSTIDYKILPNSERLLVEKIFEQNQQLKRLQEENEKIKKQYNCYACGNCNGKEDYINLEKHHKGLRKQFDELAKRNNTLSLRIEELENEKEKSKEYFKDLQVRKDRYYLQVLEYEKQVNDWINFYIKVRDIVSGNYEILDSQGLQDLRQIISEVAK